MTNPVLEIEAYSLKDASVIVRNGVYHVFSSAFTEENCRILHLTTADWLLFSDPEVIACGEEVDGVGACSPDISTDGRRFILSFNSWGQPRETPNQLFYKVSRDLDDWSEARPLAANLTAGSRCIDAALSWSGRFHILTWKNGAKARFAMADALDGAWRNIPPDGSGRLVRADGSVPQQHGIIHENAQMFRVDGTWFLLSTDFNPHEPWLYRMKGDPDEPCNWLHWVDGRRLDIPSQHFNSIPAQAPCVLAGDFTRPLLPCADQPGRVHIIDGHCNAPFIWDERDTDGHFYMLYAGKNEQGRNAFNGTAGSRDHVGGWARGWNRLALARSRDLRHWEAARDGHDRSGEREQGARSRESSE